MPCEEHSLKGHWCVRSSLCMCSQSAAFNLQWHFNLCLRACVSSVLVWALTDASLLLSSIKTQRHTGLKRWERNSSGNERKGGTDRERQSEGAEEKHEVIGGTFTSAGSLTPLSVPFFLFFFLSLVPSFSHSLSCSLCLLIISLPVTIPTTFSGVTQQKKEGASLTDSGDVI